MKKRQHIATIIRGATRTKVMSKGKIMRKIEKLMVVHKKDESTSSKTLDGPRLRYWDSEKVVEIPNDIFLIVITSMVSHLDVFEILIDRDTLCNIISYEMFKKMGLVK